MILRVSYTKLIPVTLIFKCSHFQLCQWKKSLTIQKLVLLIFDVLPRTQQAMILVYPLCSHKSSLKHAPENRISAVHFKLWLLPGTITSTKVVHFKKFFWVWNFQDSAASLSQLHLWCNFDECDVAMRRMILPIDSMKATVQSKTIWGKAGDFRWCFWISPKTAFVLIYCSARSSSSKQQHKFQTY